MKKIFSIFLCLTISGLLFADNGERLSLAGEWTVFLDPDDTLGVGSRFSGGRTITLPGTLDDADLGEDNRVQPDMSTESLVRLRRKHTYIGPAWYARTVEIPEEWKGRHIYLHLGRVLWESKVYIDGEEKDCGESLTTGHVLNLGILEPGRHSVLLRIDNRLKYKISGKADHQYTKYMSHSYTEETQSIWNGVIGDISLVSYGDTKIESVNVIPSLSEGNVRISVVSENLTKKDSKVRISMTVLSPEGKEVAVHEDQVLLSPGENTYSTKLKISEIKKWDEFTPSLYSIEVKMTGKHGCDLQKSSFGFRKIEARGNRLFINDRSLYLRGEVDCCVFPLTGYPPMNEDEWEKIMLTYRRFGLNHVRFHSWCPPAAAFDVADRLGMYLYIELPVWAFEIGKDFPTNAFMEREAERILKNYGNHPSFCFMSMGNELDGDFSWINNFVDSLKSVDSRRLYTTTTFTFAQSHGIVPEPADDFMTTQWTKDGWTRCQGKFDWQEPSFSQTFSEALSGIGKPVIVHEIGQYSIYPDLNEIEKYTGNLQPVNLLSVKNDLAKKGRLSEADNYFKATGQFSAILYKAEIEYHLRTPESNGFQLLGLKDYPGQGTAIVGMLDSFGDEKGIITCDKWRQFCSDVVPLVSFDKTVYGKNETFSGKFMLSNRSGIPVNVPVVWRLSDKEGETIIEGKLSAREYPAYSLTEGSSFSFTFSGETASAFTLIVSLEGKNIMNKWDLWYYPDSKCPEIPENIVIVHNVEDLENNIGKVEKILFLPNAREVKGIKTRFTPVFWSAVLFPDQPGSMGILCDPEHEAFSDFPTDFHADWQWWYILNNAIAVEIPENFSSSIIVQVLDNIATNRLQSMVFEFGSNGTDILVCTVGYSDENRKNLPAEQLLKSLIQYISSDNFDPKNEISSAELIDMIKIAHQ